MRPPGSLAVVLFAAAFAASGAARAGCARLADDDRLEGVVMDIGGAPAGGAAVVLAGRDARREAVADSGGRFRIEPVTPGVYLLSASAGSISSEEIRIEMREGQTPPLVTLMLRPPLPAGQVTVTAASFHTPDVFASMPIAGRLEVFLAGGNLLNDRFETGRTPVVTLGPHRTVTDGVRPAPSPAS